MDVHNIGVIIEQFVTETTFREWGSQVINFFYVIAKCNFNM